MVYFETNFSLFIELQKEKGNYFIYIPKLPLFLNNFRGKKKPLYKFKNPGYENMVSLNWSAFDCLLSSFRPSSSFT